MSTLTINSSTRTSNQAVQPRGFVSAIASFFQRVGNAYELSDAARKEAYLAGAVDLYDLEYRIREIDRRTEQTAIWMKGF